MPQPKAQAIPEERWAHYEPYIRHFLVAQGMQVEDVVTKLARHNFRIKKSQLEHRINRWQIGKAIRPEIWRHVGLQIAERQREQRESRVIHRGRTLDVSKVKDQTARNRTFTYPASPDLTLITNAQVVICTPPVLPHEPVWPSDLPWLRFYDKTFISLVSHVLRAMDLNPNTAGGQRLLTAESIVTNVHQGILRLIPENSMPQIAELEMIIATSMPEYYPGENWSRAQSLLNGSDKEVLQASLSVALYKLSNNLFDPFDDGDWELNIQVLHDCGIMRLPLPATLDDVTMNGIIRSLFHAALWRLTQDSRWLHGKNRSEILAVFRWTLSAGRIPTSHVLMSNFYTAATPLRVTPLYAAVSVGRLDLVEPLLHAGADPNHAPTGSLCSPLELALRWDMRLLSDAVERLDIIYALSKHCSPTQLYESLQLAVQSQDMGLTKTILREMPDIVDNPEEPIDPLLERIANEAADRGDAKRLGFTMDLLAHLCPARPRISFVTAEMFISAASRGHGDSILLLHGMSSGDMPMDKFGFTPLHAAARRGHQYNCALLLNLYGSDILNSCCYPPLHVASLAGFVSVVQLFIDEGANVNAVPAADSSPQSYGSTDGWGSHITDPETPKTLSALEIVRVVLRTSLSREVGLPLCAAALIRAGGRVIPGDVVLAVAHQCSEMLSAVLDFGGDPNETSEEGLTALQLSLRPTYFFHIHTAEAARLLLDRGASVTGGEANSAAILGDWTLVDRILPKRELLLDFNDGSMTALEAGIACTGDPECLVKALQLQPYIYSSGSLCAAIEKRVYWVIDHLLANRGTRSQPDCLEGTAISLAVISKDLPLLRKLLATLVPQPVTATMPSALGLWERHLFSRTKVGSWWRSERHCGQVSPLAVAAYCGTIDAFHELLHAGLFPDQMTWSIIGTQGNLSMARALIDNNQRQELDDLSHSEEFTDLLICSNPLPGSHAMRSSDALMYPDALVGSDSLISSDPLIGSIRSRNKDLVLLILELYPNINRHFWVLELKSGLTPLQAAADTGQSDLVELFLHRGADVNAPPATRNGATALQFAAVRGHLGIAQRLIDLGADTNAPAALINGRTSLEGAAENGRLDMLQLLLGRGTLTKVSGRHQYIRAIKLAIREGHCAAERLLRGHRNWEEEDHVLFEHEEDFVRQE